MFQVTLSFCEDNHNKYKPIIKAMVSDRRHKAIHVCKQMGQQGTHKHYHCIVKITEDISVQGYRRRYISYFRNAKHAMTKRNLRVQSLPKEKDFYRQYNYLYRDPKDLSGVAIYTRGFDMKKWERVSLQYALPKHKQKPLLWSDVLSKLKAVGWKYPERPGKYLLKLQNEYHLNVDLIWLNPKKLAILMRANESKDAEDWDDYFTNVNNKLTIL